MALHFNFVGIDWLTCTPSIIASPTREQWRRQHRQHWALRQHCRPKSGTAALQKLAEIERMNESKKKENVSVAIMSIAYRKIEISLRVDAERYIMNEWDECDEVWPRLGSGGHCECASVGMKRENCVRVNYKLRIDLCNRAVWVGGWGSRIRYYAYQDNVIWMKSHRARAHRPIAETLGSAKCIFFSSLVSIQMSSSQAGKHPDGTSCVADAPHLICTFENKTQVNLNKTNY